MESMTATQILKLTFCQYYVNVSNYRLTVKVNKCELRKAFKDKHRQWIGKWFYSVKVTSRPDSYKPERIYHTAIILL